MNHPPMQTSSDESSFQLLTQLLKCAELISANQPTIATDLLPELFELSSPFGSPFQRVAAFFTQSLRYHLHLRCLPPPPLHHSLLSFTLPHFHSALHSYNSLTPFIKFSHFTSNHAIFTALPSRSRSRPRPRLHIIDLDIMQGLQWPALFHILSSNNLTSLRLTAFGPSSKLLAQTGARLADFANSLRLPFEYNPIEGNIGGMSTFIKHASHDEVTVVHCMHHHLYDVLGCRVDKLMKVLRVIRPRLVTMVHQDLDVSQTDSSSFLNKFVDALHYYSALFDALGEGEGLLGRDSSVQRYEVEHHLFGTEIRNILALDGRININGGGCHPSWGNHLLQAGFEPFSLSGSPAAQAALLLEMFPSKGYTLMEENGCLKLGWKGLSLLTASAWQPSSNFGHIVSSDHHHSS